MDKYYVEGAREVDDEGRCLPADDEHAQFWTVWMRCPDGTSAARYDLDNRAAAEALAAEFEERDLLVTALSAANREIARLRDKLSPRSPGDETD